jgi:hypothetical protein
MSRAPWYAVAAVALATVATACTSSPSSSSSITTSPTVPASAVYFKTVSHPELGFRAMFPLIRGGDSVETTSGCDTGCSVGHDTNRVDVSSFVMPAGRGRYCLRYYSGRAGDACSRNYHLAQYAVSVDPESDTHHGGRSASCPVPLLRPDLHRLHLPAFEPPVCSDGTGKGSLRRQVPAVGAGDSRSHWLSPIACLGGGLIVARARQPIIKLLPPTSPEQARS